ncbi:hypothetical protein B0H65DRAFT_426410 [Neurospora tetraspora]|uniref:Uncharacterized protein n=1 Tax=Neurospora tetraspora TaxID=94610 RepID=A0AAE0JGG1_9PEZI|nr:hypothetical protein B0H65DRAFT_426410 [Neurospora tetraspora]
MSLSKPSKEPTPPPTPPSEPQATDIPLPESPLVLPPAGSPFWTTVAAQEIHHLGDIIDDKIQDNPNSVSDVDNTTNSMQESSTEERSLTPPAEAREDHQLVDLGDKNTDDKPTAMDDVDNTTTNSKRNSMSTSQDQERRSLTPPLDQVMNEPSEPEPEPEALRTLPKAKIPDMLAQLSQRITDLEAAEDAQNNGTCSTSRLLETQQRLRDATSSLLLDALAVASVVMAEEGGEDTEASVASVNPALVPLPSDDVNEDGLESGPEEYIEDFLLPSLASRAGDYLETVHYEDGNHEEEALQYPGPTGIQVPFPPSLSEYDVELELEEQNSPSLVPTFIADNLKAQNKDHQHLPDIIPTCTSYDDMDWSDLLPARAAPEDSSQATSSDSKSSLAVQLDPADVPLPEDDPFDVPLALHGHDDGSGLPDYSDLEALGDHGEIGDHGDLVLGDDESDSSQLFVDDGSPLPHWRTFLVTTSSEDKLEASPEEAQVKSDAHADVEADAGNAADAADDKQAECLLQEMVTGEKRPSKEEKGKGKAEQQDHDNHDSHPSSSISPCAQVVPPALNLSQQIVNTEYEAQQQQQQQEPEQMVSVSPRSPQVSPYSPAAMAPVALLAPPIAPVAPMGSILPDQHMGTDQLPPPQPVVVPELQQPEAAPCPGGGTQGQPTTPPTATVYVDVDKATEHEPKDDRYSPLPASSSPLLSRSSPYRVSKSSQPQPRESLLHSVPYTPAVVPWDEQRDLRLLPPLPEPERLPTYTRISKTTDNSRVMPMWFEGFSAQEWFLIEPAANLFYRRIRHHWHPYLPQWPPYIIGPTPLIMELSQIGKDGLAGEINILLHCERYSPPGFMPCQQLRSFTKFIRDCLSLQNIRDITVPDFQTVHECKTWLETVTKNGRMLSFMALHCHVERLRSGVSPGTHEFLDAIRDMGCQLGWNEGVYFSKTSVLQEFKHVPRYDSSSTPFISLRGNPNQQNLVNPGQHFDYGQGKSTDYCIALRADHPYLNIRVTLAALNTLSFEWPQWVGPPDAWVKSWDPCDEEVVGPPRRVRLAEIRVRRKDLYDEYVALKGRVDGWFENHPEPPRTALVAGGMGSRSCACRHCRYVTSHQHHHDGESECECDDETPSSSGNSSPRRTRSGFDGLQPFPRPRPLPEPPRPGFSSLADADGESILTKEELASVRRAERMVDKLDRNIDKGLLALNPLKRRKTGASAEQAEATNAEAENVDEKAAEPDTRTDAQKERQRRRNRKKKEQEKEAKKKKAARSEVVAESKAQIYESLKTGGFNREAIKDVLNETMAKIGPKSGAPEDESRGQVLANKDGLSPEEEARFRDSVKPLYAEHLRRKEAGDSTKLFGKFEIPADISEEDFFEAFLNNVVVVETNDKDGFAIDWKPDAEEGTQSQEALVDSKGGRCVPEEAQQSALDNQLGHASTEHSSVKEQEAPAEAVKPQPKDVHSTAGPSTHDVPDHDTSDVAQPKELDDIASADVSQPAAEPSTGPEAAPEAAPTVLPTDIPASPRDTPNHDATSTPNPPPLDKSKEASKAKKERRKLRKRLDREKEEARLREQAAAREELRRQAEARHQAELDRKVGEAQRKLDEEKARRLEQHQKEEAARLQRLKEEEARLQKVKEEEARRREEEEVRKRDEEQRLAEEEKKRQEEELRKEEERKKEEERIAEEKKRKFEEEARLQAEKEWYAMQEQKKLEEAVREEEARRLALEAKQNAELEARQKAELEAIRLAEVEAKLKAEEERKAEQKRKAAEAKRKADEAKKAAEEVKKKAEEARQKAEEDTRRKKEEEAKRIAEEKKRQAEAKRLAEEKRKAEAARQAEAKQQRQAELKQQVELERLAEEKRKADEEKGKADEAARQAEAAFQGELQRQAHEAERKAHEAAQKAKAAVQAELQQDAKKRKAAEAKKRAAEAKKKAVEEVERRRQADLEAAARRAQEEQQRRAREEAERLKREAQAVRKAEEEAIRRAMEEARVRREEEARIRREKEEAERLKREAEKLKKEVEEARERAEREEARKKAAEEVKRRKKAQRKAEAEAKRKTEAEAARVKAEGEEKLRQMLGIQQVDNSLTLAEQKATPFHEQQILLQEAWHQIDESLLLSQQAHNSLLRAQHHNSEAFRQLGEADLLLSLSQDVSQDCQTPQDAPSLISARHRFDEAILQAQEGYRLLQEAWDYHDSSMRTAEEGHRLLVEVGHEGEHHRSAQQYSLVEARHHNDEAFRRAEEGRRGLEEAFARMGISLQQSDKDMHHPHADNHSQTSEQEPHTILITTPPTTHHQLSDPEAETEETETLSSSFDSMSTTTSGDLPGNPSDDRPYEERLAAFINDQLVTYGVWDPESFYVRYDPCNPRGPRAHEMLVASERGSHGDAAGSDVRGVKEAWW